MMAGRMQSPSSINCYKQCPRKYYYRYIKKLPSKPRIELIRGKIVHSVLEHFFEEHPARTKEWRTSLHYHAHRLLERFWLQAEPEMEKLDQTPEELVMVKEETSRMLINWVNHFCLQLKEVMDTGLGYEEAFRVLTPMREEEYRDEELNVRGFIDAVHGNNGTVTVLDYKTSKRPEITEEYRLQLGIYALLYSRKHNKSPDKAGIHFLRHDLQLIPVTDDLLLDAQFEIEQVHNLTQTDKMKDYEKSPGPLCNYCDYYNECFGQKTLVQLTTTPQTTDDE